MAFHILRRTPRVASAATTVLILAANPEAAVDMGMRLRTLGCIAIEPRLDEDGVTAIKRLQPTVVMVQVGHRELDGDRLDEAAESMFARMIVFGKEWPEVVDVARTHAALSLPIDAPAKMIRSAIQLAIPA